jgi:hypothetical protein
MVLLRNRSQADCKFDLASAHGRGRVYDPCWPNFGISSGLISKVINAEQTESAFALRLTVSRGCPNGDLP